MKQDQKRKQKNEEPSRSALSQRKRAIKNKVAREIEDIYQEMSNREKYILSQAVNLFLKEDKRDAFIGQRFEEVLQRHNDYYGEKITSTVLANVIDGYVRVCVDEENYEKKDTDHIKSKVEKFKTQYRVSSDDKILKLVCGYLCVSVDVIQKGQGEKYSIDFEKLKQIIDKEGVDADAFLEAHKMVFFDESIFENADCDKYDECYTNYIHHSAEKFAEIVEEQYNIKKEDILKSEPYSVQTDGFRQRFEQLPDKKRTEILQIIEEVSKMSK